MGEWQVACNCQYQYTNFRDIACQEKDAGLRFQSP